MKNFFSKLLNLKTQDRDANLDSAKAALEAEMGPRDEVDRKIDALFNLLVDYYGSDKLVIKAGKMDALQYVRSPKRGERVLALQRIINENPTIKEVPKDDELLNILEQLTEQFSDILARRSVEDDLEKKVAERLEENHQDYVKDIKMQILKEEKKNVESPLEQKKREHLEELEKVSLTQSVMELLRPSSTDEIVGQKRAVDSLLAKLSSPYPQHLILYGPPGVGKTTAARLVLEEAKKRKLSPFADDAPFIETDGTTLRWDPRDMTNPLLGSVHDPIYQGARRDLADTGIPEPKPGLVTDAHGGILFIDEIGEMDVMLQNKLLKVLEDKRAFFESAYYDPADEKIPPYIKKLFEEGAPADFVLIGATTREASHINPALRSRCAEIYFEPLTPSNIQEIVRNAAKKLSADLGDGVAELISEYTIEGRKAINILADAYSLALERNAQQELDQEADTPVSIEKA
ncbi:MAG TPA: ATP-dependent protease, Lon family, partial [Anaerovibrio sp.]|nr:ATP-dependent protease, Lon family [Anaerovibrio sp.]